MPKTLQFIEGAYRCNIEEQDDPAVWITSAMKGAGADLTVLLGGNATSYAVKGQDASGLSFGGRKRTQPPRIEEDLARLTSKGVRVLVLEDDAAERGLERNDLIPGIERLRRAELARFLAGFDRIWRW